MFLVPNEEKCTCTLVNNTCLSHKKQKKKTLSFLKEGEIQNIFFVQMRKQNLFWVGWKKKNDLKGLMGLALFNFRDSWSLVAQERHQLPRGVVVRIV